MDTGTAIQTRANPEVELDFSALDRLPKDGELPYSDGEPMDTAWHRDCMTLLIGSIRHHWRNRDDYFVGGDMFVYFSPDRVFHTDFRGPDFFVAKGVDRHKKRFAYITWQENGQLPSVIIELGSESTLDRDRGEKKDLYERIRIPEYFLYDPAEPRLEGWRLTSLRGYVPIEVGPGGRMWCEQLELWVGHWDGPDHPGADPDRWLRFFDPDGNVVPTHSEAVAREARTARFDADRAKAASDTEAAARQAAETRAAAAEAENERLRQELAALRGQVPPNTP
ncbi:MAG: Uma2 family endonuclease [Gemmataceae bacterium]|nr:Uma2 family endonuclease [Gemmataceae bacterium]